MLELKNLHSELEQLRVSFHAAITKGNCFGEVKKIYGQIKVLEQLIQERTQSLSNMDKTI